MSAALLTFAAARHPDPLRLYLPDLFLDWRAVLSMCGSGVLESGALSSQHLATAASLKLLLSMHRVHVSADAEITCIAYQSCIFLGDYISATFTSPSNGGYLVITLYIF